MDLWNARHGGLEMVKACTYFLLVVGIVDTPRRMVALLVTVASGVLAMTVLAVWNRAGQPFVWVVRKSAGDGLVVDPRAVQLGPIEDQRFAVLGGLRPGERVVVSGVQKLRPGAPVAPATEQPGARG